jgi:opacity protein-like surface antigen
LSHRIALAGDNTDVWNNSYDFGFNIGYRFSNHVRMEGAYDFMRHSLSDDYKPQSYNGDAYLNMSTLMMNTYYDFYFGNLKPFVGAGVGVLIPSLSIDSDYYCDRVEQDNKFAYQGILGLDYLVSEHATIGVNYCYLSCSHNDGYCENIFNVSFNYLL